jgi:hypothetical protein
MKRVMDAIGHLELCYKWLELLIAGSHRCLWYRVMYRVNGVKKPIQMLEQLSGVFRLYRGCSAQGAK